MLGLGLLAGGLDNLDRVESNRVEENPTWKLQILLIPAQNI